MMGMKRNQTLKSIALGMLILLTVIQTTTLWLGGYPGQSFFKKEISEEAGINPQSVWIIKPSASNAALNASFAYRLDGTIESTRREYERLIAKLQTSLKLQSINTKEIETIEGIPWSKLLGFPTICYEYAVPLSLKEISGSNGPDTSIGGIDAVYIQSDTRFEKSLNLYFVSTLNNQTYQMAIKGDFKEMNKIYSYFTREELLEGVTKYQPSATSNVKNYIHNNSFMPIASGDVPIVYDLLNVYNPIDLSTSYGMKELEKRVNDFFVNPLLKDTVYEADGSITFSEQKKSIVMYNPIGIIEYINLAPKSSATASTRMSGYQVAMAFIQETDAIAEHMKDNLYLSRLETKGQEMTYYFDMAYNGYRIAFNKHIKEQLGVESLIKITVKQDQVTGVTLCTLQFEPKIIAGDIQTALLKTAYVDPINEALTVIQQEGEEVAFSDVDTVYLVNTLDGKVYLERGVQLGNRWYYP